jgi:O-antigen/teichoic acid export membrane protein
MSTSNDAVKTVFKCGILLFLGLFVQLVISFLRKLLVARGSSVSNNADITLGITMASLLSTVVLLGMEQGVGRYLPRFDERAERRGILVTGFTLTVPLGLLTGAAVLFTAPILASHVFNNPEIAPFLCNYVLIIPLIVIFRLTINVIQGRQESLPKVLLDNISRPVYDS